MSFTIFYRFQADTSKLEKSFKKIDSALKKQAASLKTMGAATNEMANKSLGGFTKMAMGLTALAVPIYKFENEMNKMVAASGRSSKEMKPLIDLTKKLGATTEHSASAAMRAATKLTQAGFSQEQAIKLLPQTLQLATAGYMDMGQAASMVSDAVKSFGLEADQSQRIVDVMAKGATLAKLDVADFSEVLGKVGGIARLQNQSFERTMAMFMGIKDSGLEASVSATGLGSIMARLSKPTKEARSAFGELGINITDMISKGAKFDDVMAALSKKHLTTAQAAKIFGIQQQKVGVALATNYDKVNKYTKQLENSQGAAKRMQDQMNKGLVGATKRFSSALEGLILQSGEQGLSGALSRLLDSMTSVITKLSKMGINWGLVSKIIIGTIASLLVFGVTMKVMAMAISIARGMVFAFMAVSKAVQFLNLTLKLLTFGNPITGFVMVAITGLIMLYMYWDKVIAFIKKKYDWVMEKVGKVKNFLGFSKDQKDSLDINKNSKISTENKINSESMNKVKVENKATLEGKIDINNKTSDYTATLSKLNLGTQ